MAKKPLRIESIPRNAGEILQWAKRTKGVSVVPTKGGHMVVILPGGERITLPSSASDHRAGLNARALIKRALKRGKAARAPKGYPTELNAWVVQQELDRHGKVPARLCPTSAPHVRRFLAWGGLVERWDGDWDVTPVGQKVLEGHGFEGQPRTGFEGQPRTGRRACGCGCGGSCGCGRGRRAAGDLSWREVPCRGWTRSCRGPGQFLIYKGGGRFHTQWMVGGRSLNVTPQAGVASFGAASAAADDFERAVT